MTVFIDAENDEQREAIVKILTGEDGGMPWEIPAATVTEIKGLETFKNPVTGEPNEVHMVIPNGFLFRDGSCATRR